MKAVLLANMGAPVSEKGMKVFLKLMFSDKAIFYAPTFVRFIFSSIISNLRYRSSWQKYLKIGGSPLQKSMNKMTADLQQMLNDDYVVSSVYSYSEPFITEKIAELYKQGIKDITVISMYPQASYSTTGCVQTSLDIMKQKFNAIQFQFVEDYYDNEYFINFWLELINAKVKEMSYNKPYLLFSAHALPQSFIKRGDAYTNKMIISAEQISQRLNLPYSVSYQSKIGRIEWTRPYTNEQLRELAGKGINEIIIVPLSFINENLETRYDLDIELVPMGLDELGITDICRIEIPESDPHLVKMFYEFITRSNENN